MKSFSKEFQKSFQTQMATLSPKLIAFGLATKLLLVAGVFAWNKATAGAQALDSGIHERVQKLETQVTQLKKSVESLKK